MKQNNLGSQQVEKSVNSVLIKCLLQRNLYRLRQIYIQEYKHFFSFGLPKNKLFKVYFR